MAELIGEAKVERDPVPSMGAEDFAFMLQQRPGSYVWLRDTRKGPAGEGMTGPGGLNTGNGWMVEPIFRLVGDQRHSQKKTPPERGQLVRRRSYCSIR